MSTNKIYMVPKMPKFADEKITKAMRSYMGKCLINLEVVDNSDHYNSIIRLKMLYDQDFMLYFCKWIDKEIELKTNSVNYDLDIVDLTCTILVGDISEDFSNITNVTDYEKLHAVSIYREGKEMFITLRGRIVHLNNKDGDYIVRKLNDFNKYKNEFVDQITKI